MCILLRSIGFWKYNISIQNFCTLNEFHAYVAQVAPASTKIMLLIAVLFLLIF